MAAELKLYTFFRNQAGYRVRIALGLKQIPYRYVSVDLLQDGGENLSDAYLAVNPQGLLPTLDVGGARIPQSLAILEYLEERYPEPPLLPADALLRGRVRALSHFICSEVTPLNNLRVHRWMSSELELAGPERRHWFEHWIGDGLSIIERILADEQEDGPFCFGASPTFADLCLVPLLDNARRNGIDLSRFPVASAVLDWCEAIPAFAEAAPARQPDARRGDA